MDDENRRPAAAQRLTLKAPGRGARCMDYRVAPLGRRGGSPDTPRKHRPGRGRELVMGLRDWLRGTMTIILERPSPKGTPQSIPKTHYKHQSKYMIINNNF